MNSLKLSFTLFASPFSRSIQLGSMLFLVMLSQGKVMAADEAIPLNELFEPKKSEFAALSPDGRYLAFSEREGENLYVSYIEVNQPDVIAGKALVGVDMTATPYMRIRGKERVPAMISWMRWVTPDILVLQNNQRFQNATGGIARLKAGEWQSELVLDPTDFIRTGQHFASRPSRIKLLDLDPDNADQVYLRCGWDADFDLYTYNVKSGEVKFIRREQTTRGRSILFTRQHRPGITIPRTSLASRPYQYLFYMDNKDSLLEKWEPLDAVIQENHEAPFSVSFENFLRDRSLPLGFNEAGSRLFVATNSGRETYAIKSLDLQSGQFSGILLEDDTYDLAAPAQSFFSESGNLIYDRFTRAFLGIRYPRIHYTAKWLDGNLQRLQQSLQTRYPERSVDILEWNEAEDRFLVRIYGHADRGSLHVFSVDAESVEDLVQVVDRGKLDPPQGSSFSYPLPDGGSISGWITLPVHSAGPAPVIIRYPDAPWKRVDPTYDPSREYLARKGYAVVDFNGRGTVGLGKQLANSIRDGYAEQQAADVRFLISQLTIEFGLDPENVALLGEFYGGFGALQAAQQYSKQFQAVVALQSPLDPPQWLLKERWSGNPFTRDAISAHILEQFFDQANNEKNIGLRKNLSELPLPVLFMANRDMRRNDFYKGFRSVASRINRSGGDAQLVELHPDYLRRLPEAKAEVFSQITDFLRDSLVPSRLPANEVSDLAAANVR